MHDDHASPHVQHMMCGAALAGLHVRGGERMCCKATRRTRVCCTSGGCLFFAWTVGRWSDERTRKARRRDSAPPPDLGLAVRRQSLPA